LTLPFLITGVDIHELPEDLKKYIQDKTSSGYGKVRLLNIGFPVFVMNPYRYKDNFKETLVDQQIDASAIFINSSVTPSGEIWEVYNIYCQTSAAAGQIIINQYDGANMTLVKRVDSDKFLDWQGIIVLDEGRSIRCQLPSGSLLLSIIGVKRFA